MRAIASFFILASMATAQEQPPPKSEQLIQLLKELRTAKDRRETIKTFAAKQEKLDAETTKFVNAAKERPNTDFTVPEATLYIECFQQFLAAKRLPEATASLNIVDDLYDEKYHQMNTSGNYFKAGFLAHDVTVIADWNVAVGQKARATTLYYRAIDCWKQRAHYDIANQGIKPNEEAREALRDKIKNLADTEKK